MLNNRFLAISFLVRYPFQSFNLLSTSSSFENLSAPPRCQRSGFSNHHTITFAICSANMDDIMDVDASPDHDQQNRSYSSSSPASPVKNMDNIVSQSLILLRTALQSFIKLQISRALGHEMLHEFQPPRNASVEKLLRYIQDKWLSMFSDSALGEQRHKIARLLDMLKSVTSDSGLLIPSIATAKEIMEAVENLLQHIGASASAAKANALIEQLSYAQSSRADCRESAGRSNMQGSSSMQLFNCSPKVSTSLPFPPSNAQTSKTKMRVVLDGSNIAWRYGMSKNFSMRGVVAALQYFHSLNHPTVLVLPEARMRRSPHNDSHAFNVVSSMQGTPQLFLTPDNDYDDAYICYFARRNEAIIVSNDAYKDHIYQESAEGPENASVWRMWFSFCRLSFTFCGDSFFPNPAFNYKKAEKVAHDLRLTS